METETLSLTVPQKKLLENYVAAVMSAPASLGLTAAPNAVEFWERHVLDALKVLAILPKGLGEASIRVVDVGSGNGVPGIPAAIAHPHWQINLIDSNNKKCGFLDAFCKSYAIKNVHVISGRAEDVGRSKDCREKFDLAFARALGKLPVVLELVMPLVKREGILVVPHGQSHQDEIRASEKAMKEIGAAFQGSTPYQLKKGVEFTLLKFLKISETPDKYPRKTGIPNKRPL